MSGTVRIAIKPAAGGESAKFTVEVPTTATILELKQEVGCETTSNKFYLSQK